MLDLENFSEEAKAILLDAGKLINLPRYWEDEEYLSIYNQWQGVTPEANWGFENFNNAARQIQQALENRAAKDRWMNPLGVNLVTKAVRNVVKEARRLNHVA